MPVSVQVLDKGAEDAYADFLDTFRNREVSAYHTLEWREVLKASVIGEPMYLIALRDGQVIGCLPTFIATVAGRSVLNSLPFFGSYGGVLVRSSEPAQAAVTCLLNALQEICEEHKCLTATIIVSPFGEDHISHQNTFEPTLAVERFAQVLPLQEQYRYEGSVEGAIGTARRHGISVTRDESPATLWESYGIYRESCESIGIPVKPWSTFSAICDHLVPKGMARAYHAVLDGEIIGSLVCLYYGRAVQYYMPATKLEFRSLQSNSLLIHHAIEEAKSEGFEIWNWEGSPSRESGVYGFKKRWGSQEMVYHCYVKLFQNMDVLWELGVEGICRDYPSYYVYPFDRLRVG